MVDMITMLMRLLIMMATAKATMILITMMEVRLCAAKEDRGEIITLRRSC